MSGDTSPKEVVRNKVNTHVEKIHGNSGVDQITTNSWWLV